MSGREHAELQHARRREAELTSRIAALEAKVKSGSSVQGEMQQSVQEMSHRLQVLSRLAVHVLALLNAIVLSLSHGNAFMEAFNRYAAVMCKLHLTVRCKNFLEHT